MIFGIDSKILVVHRRLFENDHPRFFVGQVDGYDAGIVKATGYSWVYDVIEGRFEKKRDARTKVFSVSSGTMFFYELPGATDLRHLTFKFEQGHRGLTLTDERGFQMDLSENHYTPVKLQELKP